MQRYINLFLLLLLYHSGNAQRLIARNDAVQMAIDNQLNLKAASLTVKQQQQLLNGVSGIENPELFVEATPYEPLIFGAQQRINMPGVGRSRRALQNERIRLAQLQLQGSQYDLKREVSLVYLQIQYLTEKEKLLLFQDSIYNAIKVSSKRFFDAGQINKLEELQATSQADKVRNDLMRLRAELSTEKEVFRFYTGHKDTLLFESIEMYTFIPLNDSLVTNIQQQILQQQIAIGQRELQVERSQLLPQLQAGISFPTSKEYERPVGYQAGIAIPIWRKQNRNRIAAAKMGVEIANAQYELEQQRLNAQYRQNLMNYQKELQSLAYYNNIALPQAKAIIETSQRLFQGGELNYIESLRNLQFAFDIYLVHLDNHRAYNEAVIKLNYLNGTL